MNFNPSTQFVCISIYSDTQFVCISIYSDTRYRIDPLIQYPIHTTSFSKLLQYLQVTYVKQDNLHVNFFATLHHFT